MYCTSPACHCSCVCVSTAPCPEAYGDVELERLQDILSLGDLDAADIHASWSGHAHSTC